MAEAKQAGSALPSPRIPKVMGILNIGFGSALILFGVCMGMYVAALPFISKGMIQIQKKAEADEDARRKAELKAVDDAIEAAETEAAKKELQEERKAIEARPKIMITPGMDWTQMGFNDRPFLIYSWVEVVTGLLLNVLLIVSGIGLVRRKTWGLNLGIWTGAAKIVRLLLVYSYFAVAVVPPMAQKTGEMAAKMVVQQQQAMGKKAPANLEPSLLIRIYSITYSVTAVAMILLGSIYPAILLFLLTRPGARAACDEQAPPGMELNEAW
jgi:hypothetical protein